MTIDAPMRDLEFIVAKLLGWSVKDRVPNFAQSWDETELLIRAMGSYEYTNFELRCYGDIWYAMFNCSAGPCPKHKTITNNYHGGQKSEHLEPVVAILIAAATALNSGNEFQDSDRQALRKAIKQFKKYSH